MHLYVLCVRQWQQIGNPVRLMLQHVTVQSSHILRVKSLCLKVRAWLILDGGSVVHPKRTEHSHKKLDKIWTPTYESSFDRISRLATQCTNKVRATFVTLVSAVSMAFVSFTCWSFIISANGLPCAVLGRGSHIYIPTHWRDLSLEKQLQQTLFIDVHSIFGTGAAIGDHGVEVAGLMRPVQRFSHGVIHSALYRVAG